MVKTAARKAAKMTEGEKGRMKRVKECFYVVVAASLYGVMPVIIKNAYNYGANGFNVTFYMALFSIPVYLAGMWISKVSIRFPVRKIGQCVITGLADVGTFLLLYLSYSYIPAGVATMLNFVYPITVALVMHFLFGERFGAVRIGALCIYLAGLALLYGGAISGELIGFVLALLSGLCYTVHAVYMDKSGLSGENVYVVGFYKALVVLAVTAGAGTVLQIPMQITGWQAVSSIFIAMLLCRVLSGALVMIGIRRLGAFLPSVLSTIEPVVALLVGWIVLDEAVSLVQTGGIVLILAAVLMVMASGEKAGGEEISDKKKEALRDKKNQAA